MSDYARNSTTRFSDRVESYIRYRPSYPDQAIDRLVSECGLGVDSRIADIGSGTGILSGLLLERGFRVYGVEPNREMREAGERLLSGYERFSSAAGTAEETTMEAGSIDLVVAAQAFHWFDGEKARMEFKRILKPEGWVALIWNERLVDGTPFLRAYEKLLMEAATDYESVNHMNIGEDGVRRFFGASGDCRRFVFPNRQRFDYEGLKGRCLSSSYVPNEDHPGYKTFFSRLEAIFSEHAVGGFVNFDYETSLYLGRLDGLSD